jgi:hypothetical protein
MTDKKFWPYYFDRSTSFASTEGVRANFPTATTEGASEILTPHPKHLQRLQPVLPIPERPPNAMDMMEPKVTVILWLLLTSTTHTKSIPSSHTPSSPLSLDLQRLTPSLRYSKLELSRTRTPCHSKRLCARPIEPNGWKQHNVRSHCWKPKAHGLRSQWRMHVPK